MQEGVSKMLLGALYRNDTLELPFCSRGDECNIKGGLSDQNVSECRYCFHKLLQSWKVKLQVLAKLIF